MAGVRYQNAKLRAYIAVLPGAAKRIEAQTAQIWARESQTRAPVRTGALKAGISAVGSRVQSEAPYSAFVNYGTYRMSAQPFWEPGLMAAGQHLVRIAKAELAP